jgi:hypothetical protein
MSAIYNAIHNFFVETTEVVQTTKRMSAHQTLENQRKGPGVVKSSIDIPNMTFLDSSIKVLHQGQVINSSHHPKNSEYSAARQQADQLAKSFHRSAGCHTQSPPTVRINPISKSPFGILETNDVVHRQKYSTFKLKPLFTLAVLASISCLGLYLASR